MKVDMQSVLYYIRRNTEAPSQKIPRRSPANPQTTRFLATDQIPRPPSPADHQETSPPKPSRLSIHANDSQHLFDVISYVFNWGDLSGDLVMDVGLGPERNCCNLLFKLYPNVKRVVSIDKHPANVYRAMTMSKHPRAEYQVADIWDSCALQQWNGTIDKLVSVNCFNCVYDQSLAFTNAFRLLRPGGEGGIHFNLTSGYFEWFQDLARNAKWKDYYDGKSQFIPPSHEKNYSADYYRCLLEQAGFEVLVCEEKEFIHSYASDEAIKTSAAQACVFNVEIPKALLEEFKQDAFDAFMRHNRRDELGRPCLVYSACTAIVRRPT